MRRILPRGVSEFLANCRHLSALLDDHGLQAPRAVREAANAQVIVWVRYVQLVDKHLRHVGVVVLASVDQQLLDTRGLAHDSGLGCRLYKLWPGTDDGDPVHRINALQDVGLSSQ